MTFLDREARPARTTKMVLEPAGFFEGVRIRAGDSDDEILKGYLLSLGKHQKLETRVDSETEEVIYLQASVEQFRKLLPQLVDVEIALSAYEHCPRPIKNIFRPFLVSELERIASQTT
jgi:hypothetical protein